MLISSSADLLAPVDILAVVVTEGVALPGALEEKLGDAVRALATAESFKPTAGATLSTGTLGAIDAPILLLLGGGDRSADELRIVAGLAAMHARGKGAKTLRLAAGPLDREGSRAVAEGLAAGNYRFDRYKPEGDRKAPLEAVELVDAADEEGLRQGLIHARAQALARDLVNEQAGVQTPAALALSAADLAGDRLQVKVYDEVWIKENRMGGVTGVGQGSANPPRFVHMTYTPEAAPVARIALVGKGVTYDAGGLSIKPTGGMLTMRCDMGGAGAVIGAMSAMAELGLPIEVHGIFAAAENMLGGNAFKNGDILTMRNGKTVEIHNTDAEGRLLLADCLSYVSELEGIDHCVDLATLTGAAVVALGDHYSALYTDDEALNSDLLGAAAASGEGVWRMPLEKLYRRRLNGDWGHVKNLGGRFGGSITAALFLNEFVREGLSWAHLDIAGPAFLDEPERYLTKGATGAPVRTLLRWLEGIADAKG